MATAVVRYTAAAVSDRGRKRPSNEDAYGFSIEAGVYLVCDGMGGAAAGEVASTTAVDEILRLLTQRKEEKETPLPDAAQSAICEANETIFTRAQRNHRLSGMGTTLVALATHEQRVWVLNVGDSRCYRLRDGKLERLTHDHSLVDEQVRLGQLTPAQAETSPMRNVITRAVGTQDEVAADLIEFVAMPGDLYLLASDGLMREVNDEQIAGMLRAAGDLEETLAQLIGAANEAGGHDNITCVLARAR